MLDLLSIPKGDREKVMIAIFSHFEGGYQVFSGHAYHPDGRKAIVASSTDTRKAVAYRGVSLKRRTYQKDTRGKVWRTSFMRFTSLTRIEIWIRDNRAQHYAAEDILSIASVLKMFNIPFDPHPFAGKGTKKEGN
jgi:hypothetical protein